MGLVTKKIFAKNTGLATKNLSVYIMRGKVIAEENGLIDEDNPTNIAFLTHRQLSNPDLIQEVKAPKNSKSKSQPKSQVKKPTTPAPSQPVNSNREEIMNIELERKKLELRKQQQELELNEMKIAKQNGQLIPTEVVSMLFAQHYKSVYMSFEGCFDNILQQIATKTNMSASDVALFRKQLIKDMNLAIEKSVDNSKKSLNTLINEYSEIRGRGERKLF